MPTHNTRILLSYRTMLAGTQIVPSFLLKLMEKGLAYTFISALSFHF